MRITVVAKVDIRSGEEAQIVDSLREELEGLDYEDGPVSYFVSIESIAVGR